MHINFKENTQNNNLQFLTDYAEHLTGVTDDFWEEHILNAKLYTIDFGNESIGYFSIYGDVKITMFYVEPSRINLAQTIFKQILEEYKIKTAFVATCDELFLSLCLDNHQSVEMQAYFFDGSEQYEVRSPEFGRACIAEIYPNELSEVNCETDGFFDNISQDTLVKREAVVYRLAKENTILGYGIITPIKSRPCLWDCGMITLPEHRQSGVGRSILLHLCDISRENGKIPISGCWYQNYLSKKTIESTGRYTTTRLLNIQF